MNKNKKLKRYFTLCGITLLAALFFQFMTSGSRAEEKHIVFILKTIDTTTGFWTSMIDGANMAAKEYGVKVTVMGPNSETEYEAQGQLIQKAVAMKPDAIALAPASYTHTGAYAAKIEEAGIKLVLVDSVMEEAMGSAIVATDNVEAGRKMGAFIRESVSEEAVIGVVGHVQGSSTATEREEGLREGLGELEKNIAEVVFCDSDYEKAYEITKELLRKYPEITVIAGLNEYSSVGAAKAVLELGLEDEIFMVGFDSSMKEVEYLEAEVFKAIVVQKPLNMGYLAIENTVQLLLRKEVPETVDSGSALITKDTMYTPENQKLLFPL